MRYCCGPSRSAIRAAWYGLRTWNGALRWTNFLDLREQNRSFSDMAGWFGGYGAGDWQLTGTGEPERLTGVPVTQNLFPLLGVATGARQIVHSGRMSAKSVRSAGRASQSRLLAKAVRFRPLRGGKEVDVQQPPRNRRGRAACFFRLRRPVRARHAGRYLHPLAADGGNEPARQHHDDRSAG